MTDLRGDTGTFTNRAASSHANELQKHAQVLYRALHHRSWIGVYVCNCNGIRERQARAAIDAGAAKPADIFRHCQSAARCAKCVCDMRRMIGEAKEALRYAAE
jgi:bacterioferritin-associated ferredoxin